MKQAGSIVCVVLICIFVFAIQESYAARGCNAYGHACYGGHGKRSLRDQQEGIVDAMAQMNRNDYRGHFVDPSYRQLKVFNQLFRPDERNNNLDY